MASLLNKLAGGDSSQSQSQEHSLSTILPSHGDRSEFLLLLATCISLMRKQVLDNFDPDLDVQSWTRTLDSPQGRRTTGTRSLAKDQNEPEGSASKEEDSSLAESEEQYVRTRDHRRKALEQASNIELKQASMEHFDTWRDKVVERLAEVINQDPVSDTTTKATSESQTPTPISAEGSDLLDLTEADVIARQMYPPQATSLVKLPQPQRALLLHAVLLLLLSLQSYHSESRILMLYMTASLGLSIRLLVEDENKVATGLLESAKALNADEETKKDAEAHSSSRKWKVGLGATAGAVLIGVTGGLAAPLLAAGVGSVMGGIGLASTATAGYLGAMAGSAPLVGALFGAYGGRMTARIVDEYAREVEDFAFIPLHKRRGILGRSRDDVARHLRVAICVSGYLTEEAEVTKPWQALGASTEGFALRYELKSLLNLGSALSSYIKSYAWGWAKKEIIKRTIFATLSSAISAAFALPYGITKATKLVDNPFNRAKTRSEKAGRVLAHALIAKVQGERPVTLLGYSLGARVIYYCLDELANKKAFGLVETVVVAGAVAPSDTMSWRRMRAMISGRLINAYSTNDYLLMLLYRANSLQYGIAGLQPVDDVPGIENIDVSDIVDGHTQYRFVMSQILQLVKLEDMDTSMVEKQLSEMQAQRKQDEADLQRNLAVVKPEEAELDAIEQEIVKEDKH